MSHNKQEYKVLNNIYKRTYKQFGGYSEYAMANIDLTNEELKVLSEHLKGAGIFSAFRRAPPKPATSIPTPPPLPPRPLTGTTKANPPPLPPRPQTRINPNQTTRQTKQANIQIRANQRIQQSETAKAALPQHASQFDAITDYYNIKKQLAMNPNDPALIAQFKAAQTQRAVAMGQLAVAAGMTIQEIQASQEPIVIDGKQVDSGLFKTPQDTFPQGQPSYAQPLYPPLSRVYQLIDNLYTKYVEPKKRDEQVDDKRDLTTLIIDKTGELARLEKDLIMIEGDKGDRSNPNDDIIGLSGILNHYMALYSGQEEYKNIIENKNKAVKIKSKIVMEFNKLKREIRDLKKKRDEELKNKESN